MSEVPWELWSNDLFDRDSQPTCESSGSDLTGGCAGLWRLTLDEGIQADGRPTFLWFQLRWSGGAVSLPRDPHGNLELARLKSWVLTKGVIGALAKTLAGNPTDTTARRCLSEAALASDAWDFCTMLGHPVARPLPDRRFDIEKQADLLAFLGSSAPEDATALKFSGPGIGSAAVEALAGSTKLGQLASLFFDDVAMGDEGLLRLSERASFPRLRTLLVCDSGLSDLQTTGWQAARRLLPC